MRWFGTEGTKKVPSVPARLRSLVTTPSEVEDALVVRVFQGSSSSILQLRGVLAEKSTRYAAVIWVTRTELTQFSSRALPGGVPVSCEHLLRAVVRSQLPGIGPQTFVHHDGTPSDD